MEETITAREAIEQMLADRVMSDPGFLEQLMLDPAGTAKPVIGEVMADDGELDLEQVGVTVHLETDRNIHLVVPVGTKGAEVAGFTSMSLGLDLRNTQVRRPTRGADSGGRYSDAAGCTASAVCPCSGAECSTDFKAAF